jgi:hypothetical protein
LHAESLNKPCRIEGQINDLEYGGELPPGAALFNWVPEGAF